MIRAWMEIQKKGEALLLEDSLLKDLKRQFYFLADGFGGEHGKQAAELACQAGAGFLSRQAGDLEATMPFVLRSYYSLAQNVLFNAVLYAHEKILQSQRTLSLNQKGAVSFLGTWLYQGRLVCTQVGSGGLWVFRKNKWAPLMFPQLMQTRKDPFWAEKAEGRDEELIPLQALGMSKDLEPEVREYDLFSGDILWAHTGIYTAKTRAYLECVFSEKEGLKKQISKIKKHFSTCIKNTRNLSGFLIWV